MTSDLSIDEELVLHSIGWEPVELVSGVSMHSVPVGVWNWGQGEIAYASAAYARSFAHATERIHEQCTKAGGHGVVGVHVEWAVERHHIDVALTGTAVRPVGAKVWGPSRCSCPTCPVATSPCSTPPDGHHWAWPPGPASSTPPAGRWAPP